VSHAAGTTGAGDHRSGDRADGGAELGRGNGGENPRNEAQNGGRDRNGRESAEEQA
jgi:hypothetical protein